MKEVKAIIAGSREYYYPYTDKKKLQEFYNKYSLYLEPYSSLSIQYNLEFHSDTFIVPQYSIIEVVSGDARGIDQFGIDWAVDNWIPYKTFPANWDKYGKSAGAIRNREMAEYADILFAFWDMKSPGTKHMISTMKLLNKSYFIIDLTI